MEHIHKVMESLIVMIKHYYTPQLEIQEFDSPSNESINLVTIYLIFQEQVLFLILHMILLRID